jgi:hypothetical protein
MNSVTEFEQPKCREVYFSAEQANLAHTHTHSDEDLSHKLIKRILSRLRGCIIHAHGRKIKINETRTTLQ